MYKIAKICLFLEKESWPFKNLTANVRDFNVVQQLTVIQALCCEYLCHQRYNCFKFM